MQPNKKYAFNKCDTQPAELSGKKDKTSTSTCTEAMKSQEVEKPSTAGNKFRRILTEMKDQVREIKLEKIRLL
jgi:hypothetical protein